MSLYTRNIFAAAMFMVIALVLMAMKAEMAMAKAMDNGLELGH